MYIPPAAEKDSSSSGGTEKSAQSVGQVVGNAVGHAVDAVASYMGSLSTGKETALPDGSTWIKDISLSIDGWKYSFINCFTQ